MINKFRGEYSFLSNFYSAPVKFGGLSYGSSEAAFQAQKSVSGDVRKEIASMSATAAKRMGKLIELRSDWDSIKDEVMYCVCKAKFDQNPNLKQRLIDTGNEHIEEGNNWGDRYWGTVNGVGENHLGKILMRLREEYNDER